MSAITYNGTKSSELGIYVGSQNSWKTPKRSYKKFQIPGKNGDLIVDNGRFENVILEYNVFIKNNFRTKFDDIAEWLLSPVGYQTFQDDAHQDEFRQAMFAGDIDFVMGSLMKYGTAKLKFDCTPQRYLRSGWFWKSHTGPYSAANPTSFDALPWIQVRGNGNGTLVIGNQTIQITNINNYLTIDSELMDCFKDNTNMNNRVNLGGAGFPVFTAFEATPVSFSGGITEVRIKERWWKV